MLCGIVGVVNLKILSSSRKYANVRREIADFDIIVYMLFINIDSYTM